MYKCNTKKLNIIHKIALRLPNTSKISYFYTNFDVCIGDKCILEINKQNYDIEVLEATRIFENVSLSSSVKGIYFNMDLNMPNINACFFAFKVKLMNYDNYNQYRIFVSNKYFAIDTIVVGYDTYGVIVECLDDLNTNDYDVILSAFVEYDSLITDIYSAGYPLRYILNELFSDYVYVSDLEFFKTIKSDIIFKKICVGKNYYGDFQNCENINYLINKIILYNDKSKTLLGMVSDFSKRCYPEDQTKLDVIAFNKMKYLITNTLSKIDSKDNKKP